MCSSKMGRLKLKSLGKYRIDRKLGEGAFGEVIQGTHTLSGEKVAIKIFYKVRLVCAMVARVPGPGRVVRRRPVDTGRTRDLYFP